MTSTWHEPSGSSRRPGTVGAATRPGHHRAGPAAVLLHHPRHRSSMHAASESTARASCSGWSSPTPSRCGAGQHAHPRRTVFPKPPADARPGVPLRIRARSSAPYSPRPRLPPSSPSETRNGWRSPAAAGCRHGHARLFALAQRRERWPPPPPRSPPSARGSTPHRHCVMPPRPDVAEPIWASCLYDDATDRFTSNRSVAPTAVRRACRRTPVGHRDRVHRLREQRTGSWSTTCDRRGLADAGRTVRHVLRWAWRALHGC